MLGCRATLDEGIGTRQFHARQVVVGDDDLPAAVLGGSDTCMAGDALSTVTGRSGFMPALSSTSVGDKP